LPVIDRMYGVADGSCHWDDCLAQLVELDLFDAGGLYRHDRTTRRTIQVAAYGDGLEAVGRRDGDLPAAPDDIVSSLTPGAVWLEPDVTEHVDLRNRATWPSRAAPDLFTMWGCGLIDRAQNETVYLEFLGRRGRKPFGGSTLRVLHRLLPHARRVWRLQQALAVGARKVERAVPGSTRAAILDLPFESRLRLQFKLTKAEARVAARIAGGLSLKEIADRQHISIHTVRSHLQAIYQKTDTCRQAELASMVLRQVRSPAAESGLMGELGAVAEG
jgi:DNA-binding CsgD family transcriptional regulator